MVTQLNAAAYQELGADLFDSLNALIAKYEEANAREFDEQGMNAVLRALYPDGRTDENAAAYDTILTWLRSALQKKGVPVSDAAKAILAKADAAKDVNAETRIETNRLTTIQSLKSLYIKKDQPLTSRERQELQNEIGNVMRHAYSSMPWGMADGAVAEAKRQAHEELNR